MDAGIDAVGFRLVATETRDAEIGFHKSRFHVGDAHTGVDKVDAQAVGKSFHSRLRGAIHIASGISLVARNAANVDYVPVVALHHVWHNEARHRKQSLDIGVNHC